MAQRIRLHKTFITLTALLLLSELHYGESYAPLPTKGKKHRTTTTTTEGPGNLNEIDQFGNSLTLPGPPSPGYSPPSPSPTFTGPYNPGSSPSVSPTFTGPYSPGSSPSVSPTFTGPYSPGSSPSTSPGFTGPHSPGSSPSTSPGFPGPHSPGSSPSTSPGFPGPHSPGSSPPTNLVPSGSTEHGGSFWWQGPNSPFSPNSKPEPQSPSKPTSPTLGSGGCGGPAGCAGLGAPPEQPSADTKPVDVQSNPFLSSVLGIKPSVNPSYSGQSSLPGQPGCGGPGGSCQFPPTKPSGQPGCGGPGGSCQFPPTNVVSSGQPGCGTPGGSCQITTASRPRPGYGSFPGESSAPSISPSPNEQYSTPQGKIQCYTAGYACVPSHVCSNGVVDENKLYDSSSPSKECIQQKEVCCKINRQPGTNYPTVAGSPSTPFSSNGYGSQPGKPGTNGIPIGGSIFDQPGPGQSTSYPVIYSSTTVKPYTGPLNTTPYPGCAAALKCVPEIYCTIGGVMSDTPVVITYKDIENKVPLTDCINMTTGVTGKCCRDPNYKDPWPAGMMKNNGFDDGLYHPDQSATINHNAGLYYNVAPTTSQPVKGHTVKVPLGVFNQNPTPFPTKPSTYSYKPSYNEPSQPTQPGYYGQPTQFGQPGQPGQPEYSSQPGQPGQPGQSGKPVYPGQYGQPDQSGQSGQPEYPSQSGQPGQSGQPEHPGQSGQPGQLGYPGQTGQPGQPEYPSQSGQPGKPGQPGQPGQLGQHGQPVKPTQPGFIGQPTQPEYINQYGQPSQPSQPGHTEQSGQSSQPSTPYQPTPSIKPSASPSYFPSKQPSVSILPSAPSSPSSSYQPAPSDSSPAFSCGQRKASFDSPFEAGFAEFPWQAVIVSAGNRTGLCGAAIISETGVITAAHCVEDARSNEILVKAGVWKYNSNDHRKPEQVRTVAAIARHPGFDTGSLAKDLAILILSQPFTFDEHVGKICLPSSTGPEYYPTASSTCVVTGWGKPVLQGAVPNSILHKVDVNIVPTYQCESILKQSHLGKYFILNKGFSCALPSNEADICQVDVGGPLACDNGNGIYELAGVNSWDIGCTTKTKVPTVFATCDDAWIQTVLSTPTVDLVAQEEVYNQNKHKGESLDGVDIDDKPGFALGYGKK